MRTIDGGVTVMGCVGSVGSGLVAIGRVLGGWTTWLEVTNVFASPMCDDDAMVMYHHHCHFAFRG